MDDITIVVTDHVVKRLMERSGADGVFDPRIRELVPLGGVNRRRMEAIIRLHVLRAHRLPPIGLQLYRALGGRYDLLPADYEVVRFDDYVYFVKRKAASVIILTMLKVGEEQMEILKVSPFELYVSLRPDVYVALAHGLRSVVENVKPYQAEDMVRRAVHYGVSITFDRAREILLDRFAVGSRQWAWFAGPLTTAWESEQEVHPRTIIVGAQFYNQISSIQAAYVLDEPFDPSRWSAEEVAAVVPTIITTASETSVEKDPGPTRDLKLGSVIVLPVQEGKVVTTTGRFLDSLFAAEQRPYATWIALLKSAAPHLREFPSELVPVLFGKRGAVNNPRLFVAPVEIPVGRSRALALLVSEKPSSVRWQGQDAVLSPLSLEQILERCADLPAVQDADGVRTEGIQLLALPHGHTEVWVKMNGLRKFLDERMLRPLQLQTPFVRQLSGWGLYQLFTERDSRVVGCVVPVSPVAGSPTQRVAMTYTQDQRGRWNIMDAKVVDRELSEDYFLPRCSQPS